MMGSPDCGRLFPAYSADRVSFAAGLAEVKHCVQMLRRELSENVKQRVVGTILKTMTMSTRRSPVWCVLRSCNSSQCME